MLKDILVFKKELPRGFFCVYQSRPDFDFIQVKQTHSSIVLHEKDCHNIEDVEADGMVGQSSSPMAIRTADCMPIVLLGEKGHAFVHAGWRGLHNQILKSDLIKRINPIYAFIGPHISECHYEVGPDFRQNFSYPNAFKEREETLYFNLSIVAQAQLKEHYFGISIEDAGMCTFGNDVFHSYRRNKTVARNWNIYKPNWS